MNPAPLDIDTLTGIGVDIRNTIKDYMKNNADFGNLVSTRPRDITRKIDMVAEKSLDDALVARGLSARIISEELGDRIVGNDPRFMLVFDPIDGSTNATAGIPFFCTSIAYIGKLENAGFDDIEMGVICDFLDNTYHAVSGKGAFLNGKKIGQRKTGARPKKVISVYSYGVPYVPPGLIELEKKVIVRALGSIALDICYVADGILDAVIDTRGLVSAYDIMASVLILKEAGGYLSNLKGGKITGDVKATSISFIGSKDKDLHEWIVEGLR